MPIWCIIVSLATDMQRCGCSSSPTAVSSTAKLSEHTMTTFVDGFTMRTFTASIEMETTVTGVIKSMASMELLQPIMTVSTSLSTI